LTTDGYNKRGGISRYVAEMAEHFAVENEVHVYATRWTDVHNDKIIFHKVPTIPGPRVIRSIPFTMMNTLRLGLSRSKFDIIHINGCDSLCQDIITAHSIHRAGMEFKKNKKEIEGLGVLDIYNRIIETLNYSKRNYKKIICVSQSSKEELMLYYNVPDKDIVVIPNGVNLGEFYSLDKASLENLKRKYNIFPEDFVLVIVATEFYRKGVAELINAVDVLVNRRNHKNIKLLVIGNAAVEGSRKGDIFYRDLAAKLGVSSKIIFTSMVNDLNAHYNLGDIFVFPTKYEAFGIPTLEAMSCALPVINSKIGAGELITDGHDGLHLDNPNDVEEIADKIEMLIIDENIRRKLGNNARKTAMKYSWDEIAKKTMNVYKSVYNTRI